MADIDRDLLWSASRELSQLARNHELSPGSRLDGVLLTARGTVLVTWTDSACGVHREEISVHG